MKRIFFAIILFYFLCFVHSNSIYGDSNIIEAENFNLSDTLVTPNPSNHTQKLYRFLLDNFRKNIISGVMTLNSFDETNWLKQQTGKESALLGLDFMHCNRDYNWYNNDAPVNDAKIWYNKNGIPALCWHWRDPSRETEAFYTKDISFDISKIFDENSSEYKAIIDDIDFIAGLLKELEDDIPILWRPLHEASGGWFWWGAKGPEACKKLWQILFERFVNYHQINNLIWVWTTDTRNDNMDWYPGDEYVDILGVDIYTDQGDFSSQVVTFEKIRDAFEGKKMVTLSECGVIPDPDKMIEDEAHWSYFMPWYGDFVKDGNYNPLTHWRKVLNHENVITLDEMPDLKDYVTSMQNHIINPNDKFILSIDYLQQICQIKPENCTSKFDVAFYNLSGNCIYRKRNLSGINNTPLYYLQKGLTIAIVESNQNKYSFKIIL